MTNKWNDKSWQKDFLKSNEKEFKSFLNNYFKTRSNTPKTKVDAINPTPINPAMIPVFR